MMPSRTAPTLLSIVFATVQILCTVKTQDIHHNLPDNLEIIDPKSLGLSGADLEKFLGNVKLLPLNGDFGGAGPGGPKTQILTVGFDGNEKLNLDDFENLSTAGLGDGDKTVAEMAFRKFKDYFKNPASAMTFEEATTGSTEQSPGQTYATTTIPVTTTGIPETSPVPVGRHKQKKRVRVGKRPVYSSTFRSTNISPSPETATDPSTFYKPEDVQNYARVIQELQTKAPILNNFQRPQPAFGEKEASSSLQANYGSNSQESNGNQESQPQQQNQNEFHQHQVRFKIDMSRPTQNTQHYVVGQQVVRQSDPQHQQQQYPVGNQEQPQQQLIQFGLRQQEQKPKQQYTVRQPESQQQQHNVVQQQEQQQQHVQKQQDRPQQAYNVRQQEQPQEQYKVRQQQRQPTVQPQQQQYVAQQQPRQQQYATQIQEPNPTTQPQQQYRALNQEQIQYSTQIQEPGSTQQPQQKQIYPSVKPNPTAQAQQNDPFAQQVSRPFPHVKPQNSFLTALQNSFQAFQTTAQPQAPQQQSYQQQPQNSFNQQQQAQPNSHTQNEQQHRNPQNFPNQQQQHQQSSQDFRNPNQQKSSQNLNQQQQQQLPQNFNQQQQQPPQNFNQHQQQQKSSQNLNQQQQKQAPQNFNQQQKQQQSLQNFPNQQQQLQPSPQQLFDQLHQRQQPSLPPLKHNSLAESTPYAQQQQHAFITTTPAPFQFPPHNRFQQQTTSRVDPSSITFTTPRTEPLSGVFQVTPSTGMIPLATHENAMNAYNSRINRQKSIDTNNQIKQANQAEGFSSSNSIQQQQPFPNEFRNQHPQQQQNNFRPIQQHQQQQQQQPQTQNGFRQQHQQQHPVNPAFRQPLQPDLRQQHPPNQNFRQQPQANPNFQHPGSFPQPSQHFRQEVPFGGNGAHNGRPRPQPIFRLRPQPGNFRQPPPPTSYSMREQRFPMMFRQSPIPNPPNGNFNQSPVPLQEQNSVQRPVYMMRQEHPIPGPAPRQFPDPTTLPPSDHHAEASMYTQALGYKVQSIKSAPLIGSFTYRT